VNSDCCSGYCMESGQDRICWCKEDGTGCSATSECCESTGSTCVNGFCYSCRNLGDFCERSLECCSSKCGTDPFGNPACVVNNT
jgi:hypothetical protein